MTVVQNIIAYFYCKRNTNSFSFFLTTTDWTDHTHRSSDIKEVKQKRIPFS